MRRERANRVLLMVGGVALVAVIVALVWRGKGNAAEVNAVEVNAVEGKLLESGVYQLGIIQAEVIRESSGVVRSGVQEGLFWTHNDGGGSRAMALYGIDRGGRLLATVPLKGVTLVDWEDIAVDGAGGLYIADTGNNNLDRTTILVHRIKEPAPGDSGVAGFERSWSLTFPESPFDCESLFIWKGHGYLISKWTGDRQAEIYRFALDDGEAPQILERVTEVDVTSPVTGADLSADGRYLGVVAKAGAYVFRVDGDIRRAGAVKPERTKFKMGQIEGCCFVAEGLLAIAETREIFLFTGLIEIPR